MPLPELGGPSALSDMIASRRRDLANLLSQRNQDIANLYAAGYTAAAIAKYHAMTQERVCQLLRPQSIRKRGGDMRPPAA